MKKEKKLFIILIAAIIIVVSFSFGILKLIKNNSKEDISDIQENKDEDGSKNDKVLEFFLSKNGTLCYNDTSDCKKINIKTETNDAKFLVGDALISRYVLYKDDNVKLYDIYTEKTKNINLNDEYDKYKILLSNDLTKVTGLFLENSSKIDLYNFLNNELTTIKEKSSEEDAYYLYNNRFDGKYLAKTFTRGTNDYIIYDVEKNENLLSVSDYEKIIDFPCGKIDSKAIKSDDNYYFYVSCVAASAPFYEVFYNENGNLIVKMNTTTRYDKKEGEYYLYSIIDGYLYIASENEILKYNQDGKILNTIKDYKNIMGLKDKFVFYQDENKNLMYSDINTKESKKIMNIDILGDIEIIDFSINYFENSEYRDFSLKEPGFYLYFDFNSDQGFDYKEYYYNLEKNTLEEVK